MRRYRTGRISDYGRAKMAVRLLDQARILVRMWDREEADPLRGAIGRALVTAKLVEREVRDGRWM